MSSQYWKLIALFFFARADSSQTNFLKGSTFLNIFKMLMETLGIISVRILAKLVDLICVTIPCSMRWKFILLIYPGNENWLGKPYIRSCCLLDIWFIAPSIASSNKPSPKYDLSVKVSAIWADRISLCPSQELHGNKVILLQKGLMNLVELIKGF